MPAIISNAKEFLVNTDFPFDTILDYRSGSISVAATSTSQETIPHGLSYNPLIVASWSHDATFSTSYESSATSGNFPNTTRLDIGANSSNIQINAINNTGSARTYYWRIYTLPRHNQDPNITTTASIAQNDFILNSDRNYTKLYLSGAVTSNTTINHNLGYIPQAMIWRTVSTGSMTYPATTGFLHVDPSLGDSSIEMTTTQMIIKMGGSLSEINYRIYLDD